jgi:hypothetical protein
MPITECISRQLTFECTSQKLQTHYLLCHFRGPPNGILFEKYLPEFYKQITQSSLLGLILNTEPTGGVRAGNRPCPRTEGRRRMDR